MSCRGGIKIGVLSFLFFTNVGRAQVSYSAIVQDLYDKESLCQLAPKGRNVPYSLKKKDGTLEPPFYFRLPVTPDQPFVLNVENAQTEQFQGEKVYIMSYESHPLVIFLSESAKEKGPIKYGTAFYCESSKEHMKSCLSILEYLNNELIEYFIYKENFGRIEMPKGLSSSDIYDTLACSRKILCEIEKKLRPGSPQTLKHCR